MSCLSLTAANLKATIGWYTSKLDYTVERRFDPHGISLAFIARQEIRIDQVGAASTARCASCVRWGEN
jgi:hypothetical protein